ncbi:grpE protein homolog, mitochondrial [Maniola hyperantus]|uniref:grpE protein homolog, mitochondrial n=1 Tax=Aphantopus hyperantus TaxID=2795564 RepID=UPI001569592D|nr:grpE protein homolog, mitochondrial [Maniola hyperantus]XP_034837996.1 grpE protein homolog, mitochondrial [Maniola hyperantus]
MASLKVYSVGRLARYVTESSLRNIRKNLYRSSAARYSTEEKAAEPDASDKHLPTSIDECHKQIETLTSEVSKLKQQLSDYEDKYKRALADSENVRRRMLKQVEDAKSFAIQSFCKDLLDVADTLSAAAESVPEGVEGEGAPAALRSLRDGLKLTKAQLTQVFSRHGLVVVSPLREKFDPNLHEALFQQEVEGAEPGTVVAVSKVGYKLHERCVRPALVGVAKGSS